MFYRSQRFGLAFLVALLAVAPQSGRAQSTEIARFVGTYDAVQPGGDSSLKLSLELAAHGVATMRGAFAGPAKTASVLPSYVEEGTWAVGGPAAIVHLTRVGHLVRDKPGGFRKEDVTLAFTLRHCTLTLTRDPASVFGKRGITMKKRGC